MEKSKEYWYTRMQKLLKETGGRPGEISIRADLCSQIISMPQEILFELCNDLNSLPEYWVEAPKASLNCDVCGQHFGACPQAGDEIDYEQCRQRFWLYADRIAGYAV